MVNGLLLVSKKKKKYFFHSNKKKGNICFTLTKTKNLGC